uniref:Uncharacterized protein n=1 Tax=Avena sativa TaxID=4498 RepID=A0ACD6AF21_AVESA
MALRTLASKKTLAVVLGGARPLATRGVATFTLPDLPYDYGALEPAISGEIMRLHHQKHHATYVANYNKALEQLDAAVSKGDASAVVQLQGAIKFNGGGHVNHSIFWKNLKPTNEGGGEPPHGKLGWAIDEDFGSFDKLVKKMNAEGAALQGSGWVWLALDKEAKKLSVETTANQGPQRGVGLREDGGEKSRARWKTTIMHPLAVVGAPFFGRLLKEAAQRSNLSKQGSRADVF